MIRNLHISNYKSIDKLDLNCERINVFVGEPNTGKSNILEALDLSFLSWMMGMNQDINEWNEKDTSKKKDTINLKDYFRINNAEELFHIGNISNPIVVSHPGYSYDTYLEFKHDQISDTNFFHLKTSNGSFTNFDNDLKPIEPIQFFGSPIKPYKYQSKLNFHDIGNYIQRLMPPYGNNLAKVIFYNNDLMELANEFATQSGFELVINQTTNEINIQVRLNNAVVYTIPFKAMADTFKRMLFYIAAVKHNNASVITLDEPDTHAFPNYVSLLADEIIKQKNNQFFITTHNPYLFGEFIEQTPKGELAVFICGFNKTDKSTYVRRLTDEDLSELVGYGIDIFFNLNPYLNEGIQHSS
jgi:AAA15 family ATPase/GTPase